MISVSEFSLLLVNSLFFLLVNGEPVVSSPCPTPCPRYSLSNSIVPNPAPSPSNYARAIPSPAPSPSNSFSNSINVPKPAPGPSKTNQVAQNPAPSPGNNSIVPTPAQSPSSIPPNSGSNGSVVPAPPINSKCPAKPHTLMACSIMLKGAVVGLPRNICCRGLRGLSNAEVYSCVGHALAAKIMKAHLTVPAAMNLVLQVCLL